MFKIDYEDYDGVSSYYFDHMDGVRLFYILQSDPNWESQENLQWTRQRSDGEDRIELVVVRLEFYTEEEYKEAIVKYPNFNAQIKVWGRKFEDLEDIEDFIMWGEPPNLEWVAEQLNNYHKQG